MSISSSNDKLAQRGMVLVSTLLLLIVVTIIALSMFRSFGIQEKIAGNVREKQRAVQAAVSAETFAETWLIGNAASTASGACSKAVVANISSVPICSNALSMSADAPNHDVTVVPWTISGAPVGVSYNPANLAGNMTIGGATSAAYVANTSTYTGTYAAAPSFYISDMGPSIDPAYPGEVYQVDSVGYGANSNTAAEVESTYVVYTTSHQL